MSCCMCEKPAAAGRYCFTHLEEETEGLSRDDLDAALAFYTDRVEARPPVKRTVTINLTADFHARTRAAKDAVEKAIGYLALWGTEGTAMETLCHIFGQADGNLSADYYRVKEGHTDSSSTPARPENATHYFTLFALWDAAKGTYSFHS